MNESVASRLCAECGLCCNGGLFDSVELQPGDSARALTALGFKMKREKGTFWFRQPCTAHRECACAIYDERPTRCRLFECHILRRVAAGELSEAQARQTISEALALVGRINQLIAQVAETNPRRSLAKRIASALATDEPTALHRELELARDAYEDLANREFRRQFDE